MASAATVVLLLIIFILIALLVLGYFKYRDEVNKPIVQTKCPEIKSAQQTICPECPDCNCPECPDCNCPVNEQKLKSAETEISYLKMMVKFLGSIARRENAINRAVLRECPATFSMIPMIQSVDQEFQYIRNDIGVNYDMLGYFNENFTRLSGIPSTSYTEIL